MAKVSAFTNNSLEEEITNRFKQEFANNQKRETSEPQKKVEPEKIFTVAAPAAAKANDTTFSTVFGQVPPSGIDHILNSIAFKLTDWTTEQQRFIPKIDPKYIWQWSQLEDLVVALLINDRTWISGPRGSGKSSLVEQVCAKLCWPFIRINGRGDMDSSGVFGMVRVQSNKGSPETVWVDGPVTEAVKMGAVLLFDEPTVVPPEISMGLQWLLEDNGKLMLADKPGDLSEKMVDPHPNFRIVCADNTRGRGDSSGDYAGTGNWNTATLDRFSTTINLPYLDNKHQEAIITSKCPGISTKLASQMVTLSVRIQNAYTNGSMAFSMSPRTLLSWAKKALVFRDVKKAFITAFYEKLDEDVERKEAENLYYAVFGDHLNGHL